MVVNCVIRYVSLGAWKPSVHVPKREVVNRFSEGTGYPSESWEQVI